MAGSKGAQFPEDSSEARHRACVFGRASAWLPVLPGFKASQEITLITDSLPDLHMWSWTLGRLCRRSTRREEGQKALQWTPRAPWPRACFLERSQRAVGPHELGENPSSATHGDDGGRSKPLPPYPENGVELLLQGCCSME